jgi:hypothetical protein
MQRWTVFAAGCIPVAQAFSKGKKKKVMHYLFILFSIISLRLIVFRPICNLCAEQKYPALK